MHFRAEPDTEVRQLARMITIHCSCHIHGVQGSTTVSTSVASYRLFRCWPIVSHRIPSSHSWRITLSVLPKRCNQLNAGFRTPRTLSGFEKPSQLLGPSASAVVATFENGNDIEEIEETKIITPVCSFLDGGFEPRAAEQGEFIRWLTPSRGRPINVLHVVFKI